MRSSWETLVVYWEISIRCCIFCTCCIKKVKYLNLYVQWTRWHMLREEVGNRRAPPWPATAQAQGARQSHHPAGVLAKARGRTWLWCKGRATGSLGAFPLAKVKVGNFVGKSGHSCSSQGQSPGPGSALFVRNSQHGEPGVAHPLPSSPAQGGNPPAATQHDISKPYGQRETIPHGAMSDGGRDQL